MNEQKRPYEYGSTILFNYDSEMGNMAILYGPDDYYWALIPEEYARPGDGLFLDGLRKVSILSQNEQDRIFEILDNIPPEVIEALEESVAEGM